MCIRKIEQALVQQFWTRKLEVFPYYTIKEISKMINADYYNVRRSLSKGVELGIINENKIVPNKPTYQLNRAYYLEYYRQKTES